MWKKKKNNVGGEFAAAVLPRSVKTPAGPDGSTQAIKRSSALVALPRLISIRMQGSRLKHKKPLGVLPAGLHPRPEDSVRLGAQGHFSNIPVTLQSIFGVLELGSFL